VCIVQPTAGIAHAALSHIAVSSDTPELRDLYAELLLKAMDSRTAATVHPAYFHIVEQLAPEEALVLVGLYELRREDLFSEKTSPYTASQGTSRPSTVEEQFTTFCESILSRTPSGSDVWLVNLCRLGLISLQTFGEAVLREEGHTRHGYYPPSVDNHEFRLLSFTEFGKGFISACAPPSISGP
jgi:hypothetical protein